MPLSHPAGAPPRAVLGVLLAGLVVGWASIGRGDASDEPKAEQALKKLRERFRGTKVDRGRYRQELLDFRVAFPGTSAAIEAGALLKGLPSPLDRLDPKDIPPLEKFDWQPKDLVAVIGEHRQRHGSYVACVAASPDGKLVASGGSAAVRLWEPGTMRIKTGFLHAGDVTGIAFSPDSKSLAVGGLAGIVQVWDMTKIYPQPKLRLSVKAGSAVHAVAFSPSSKLVAAGCIDGTTRVYDVTGKTAKELATLGGGGRMVRAVAFSGDGKTLASGGQDSRVHLWRLGNGKFQDGPVLSGHKDQITGLAFHPKSTMLASGSQDGSVRLWSIPASARAKERLIIPSPAWVNGVSFSHTGNTIATAGGDGVIRLWAINTVKPKERARLVGHPMAVWSVAYSPDSKTLLSGSADWTIRSWDTARARQRFEPWSHLSQVHSAAFSPDGKTLASGSEDTTVCLWDMTRPNQQRKHVTLKGDKPVWKVAWSPDGRTVAAGGDQETVRQWSAEGRPKTSLKNPGPVKDLVWSGDGRRLLVGGGKELVLWDLRAGKEIKRLSGHRSQIQSLAWSADGRYAFSGSGERPEGANAFIDTVLRQWDVEANREVQVNRAHKTPVQRLALSLDGKLLYSVASTETQVRRWAVGPKGLTPQTPLKGNEGGMAFDVAVAADGQTIATLGLDHQVIVWDVATGKRVKEWLIPEYVIGVAFASDSRHVAALLGTGVVYILRVEGPAG